YFGKQMFITDLLFSSPRLRFSQAQKKAVLAWAKALHAKDVPSLYALTKGQESVKKLVGNPTQKFTSKSGNIFYINDIGHAIAKDYANPLTRHAMQDFPEDCEGYASEIWHGEKALLEGPHGIVTPAVRVNGQIYFTKELVLLDLDEYFIPERFYADHRHPSQRSQDIREENLMAIGMMHGFVVQEEKTIVPTSSFRKPFDQLEKSLSTQAHLGFAGTAHFANSMPHPMRARANGRMCYSVPLIIFMDDVSGNVSKQWNKHHVVYMSNANLPRQMVEKEFCVRFVSSSPHATPMELMEAVRDSINAAAETGIPTWDCKYDEEVLLLPYGLLFAGDNPMQAEECSHVGLNANLFCRTCNAGGNKAEKSSFEGYSQLFTSGEIRRPSETKEEIRQQVALSTIPGAATKIEALRKASGVSDRSLNGIISTVVDFGKELRKVKMSDLQRSSEAEIKKRLEDELEKLLNGQSVDEHFNPLLGLAGNLNLIGVDIHKDTPTEILHTVLLGVVKYFWGQTVFIIEKAKSLTLLQSRMESLSKCGLDLPSFNPDYMCRYRGSLIGKHFKSLAQVMPFLVYDLVPQVVVDGWNIIGELVVLLWHTEIIEREEYLAQLSRTIDDFLNITAQCAPSIIIAKPKFHFLLHLPMYIRRFGPAIIFSTERYESFNHVFRLSSILSNRQAPSRDSCNTFAAQDISKHVALGGYWFDNDQKQWRHAGPDILDYMEMHPEHAIHLGFPRQVRNTPGKHSASDTIDRYNPEVLGVVALIKDKGTRTSSVTAIPWSSTRCAKAGGIPSTAPSSRQKIVYCLVDSIMLNMGDKVKIGDDVILQREGHENVCPPKQ
ncbi:hypothetical protein BDW22DRAFT_1470253, partial [Trametopsis cervina]